MAHASDAIEIEGSPSKLLMLCGIGILMTAVSVAVAVPLLPDLQPGLFVQALCYVGVVFFALCTVVAFWRLMTTRGPVVTITADGIRDTRIASDIIPWRAVQGLSTWEYSGQKIMVVKVDPAVERGLHLSAMASLTRSANTALGADGLCITAQGLKIEYPELFAASTARFNASKGGA
jgi:hypothetical protein